VECPRQRRGGEARACGGGGMLCRIHRLGARAKRGAQPSRPADCDHPPSFWHSHPRGNKANRGTVRCRHCPAGVRVSARETVDRAERFGAHAARGADRSPSGSRSAQQVFPQTAMERRLPVIPPTAERVARMVDYTRRAPDEIIATIAPAFGAATVREHCDQRVLAGCYPEHIRYLSPRFLRWPRRNSICDTSRRRRIPLRCGGNSRSVTREVLPPANEESNI